MTIANLRLNFDYRDEDALAALQDTFGQTFNPTETAAWRTVGDIEDAVVARVVHSESRDGTCLSSMAFYRLRRLLAATGSPHRIMPSQRVRDVTALTPRSLCDALKQNGLEPPSYGSIRLMIAGVVAVASLAPIAAGIFNAAPASLVAGFVGLVVSAILATTAQGHYSPKLTVGDVSLMLVDLNIARFAAQGGRIDDRAARRAVRRILAEAADCDLRAITRNTLLVT